MCVCVHACTCAHALIHTHANDVCDIKRLPELLKLIVSPRLRTSDLLGAKAWEKEKMKREGVRSSLQFPRMHWESHLHSK